MAKKIKNQETMITEAPICTACNGTGARNFGPICSVCDGSGRPPAGVATSEEDIDGNPVPPTIETVIAAGYSEEAAAAIVAEENAKAEAGEPPYGDKAIAEDAGAE